MPSFGRIEATARNSLTVRCMRYGVAKDVTEDERFQMIIDMFLFDLGHLSRFWCENQSRSFKPGTIYLLLMEASLNLF